jgi:hypothetical protein
MNDLDPTQTEAVRRALAAARHDEPVPAEVAARLDAALAVLVAEETEPVVAAALVAPSAEGATVIPLRRRRLPVLLAAAAAVVATAVAVPQLIDRPSADLHSTAARDSVPTTGDSAEAGDHEARGPMSPQDLDSTLSKSGVTQLRDETLRHDVANLLVQRGRTTLDVLPEGYDNRGSSSGELGGLADDAAPEASKADRSVSANGPWAAAAARGCGPSEPPAGSRIFHARYEGHRAIVVAFAPTPDGTPVHVYDCRTAPRVPTRMFTLPLAD